MKSECEGCGKVTDLEPMSHLCRDCYEEYLRVEAETEWPWIGEREVQKLVALKHDYKDEVALAEAYLRAKYEEELTNAKKDLKRKYFKKIVDWFYSSGFDGNVQAAAPPVASPEIDVTPPPPQAVDFTVTPGTTTDPNEIEPKDEAETTETQVTGSEPVLSTRACDNCGSSVAEDAKFCDRCAAPVKTETQTNQPSGPVAPAFRMTYPHRYGGRTPTPVERERTIRIAQQAAVAPKPHTLKPRPLVSPDDIDRRVNDWARTKRR